MYYSIILKEKLSSWNIILGQINLSLEYVLKTWFCTTSVRGPTILDVDLPFMLKEWTLLPVNKFKQ